jgi:hypothetical protein
VAICAIAGSSGKLEESFGGSACLAPKRDCLLLQIVLQRAW